MQIISNVKGVCADFFQREDLWGRDTAFQGRTHRFCPLACLYFLFFYIVTLEQHTEQGSFNLFFFFTFFFSNAETTRSETSAKDDTHIMSSVYFSPGSDSGVNG